MKIGDTIGAVSTPRGKGGVALLRISGPDAFSICDRVFHPLGKKKLSECRPREAVYGSIFAPAKNGEWESVDDGIATLFQAPKSFTGEDTVEICCHGGILLTETVLTAVFAAGARPAEAGEFTRRAVLNGKMPLSSAEALGNLLEAENREQLTVAHTGVSGVLSKECQEVYEDLRRILSSIYVKIDYPDEDLADMSREEMAEKLAKCSAKLEKLSATYKTGHAIAEGIQTVICGSPNVGKSSLYNRLVGEEAAIVTDIAGTTRDVLTSTVSLGRVTLHLCDTAGLRKTDNPVEKIGVERTKEQMKSAELVLYVLDASNPENRDAETEAFLESFGGCIVTLLNKSDLNRQKIELPSFLGKAIQISANSGEGFDLLAAKVEELFTDGKIDSSKDAILTNARQYATVMRAGEAVKRAEKALAEGLSIELSCSDAEEAMEALSELDGRAVSEDIVSEIFSHFCVGK